MDRSEPLVSIITVCYNSAATIRTTLESVAMQSYPRIEHIIVDGRSSDKTLEMVSQFPHVSKIISEKDQGIYDAMNKGILTSHGEITGILNSDDFYTGEDVIADIVRAMQKEQAEALYADLIYVSLDNTDKKIRTWKAGHFRRRRFLFGWMPPHPTFFVRRDLYARFGLFNLMLKSSADYELMLRFLFKNNVSVAYLPKTIVKMRAGGHSNASMAHRIRANREDRMAWELNGLKPYFFTTILKPLGKLGQYFS